MPTVKVFDVAAEGGDVELWGKKIVFRFKPFGKYAAVRGYAVDVAQAEKIAIGALCLASYLECVEEAKGEAGLEAECRTAYRDCLYNAEAFAEHAKYVHDKFMEKAEAQRGGRP